MTGIMYDVIAAAIVLLFLLIGVKRGFIKSVVRMVGWLVSFAAAFILSAPVTAIFAADESDTTRLVWRAASFVVIFLAAFIALRLIGGLIDKIVSFLPVIKQLNGLLGGAMGAVEGVLIVLVLCVALQLYIVMTADSGIVTAAQIEETFLVSRLMLLPF